MGLLYLQIVFTYWKIALLGSLLSSLDMGKKVWFTWTISMIISTYLGRSLKFMWEKYSYFLKHNSGEKLTLRFLRSSYWYSTFDGSVLLISIKGTSHYLNYGASVCGVGNESQENSQSGSTLKFLSVQWSRACDVTFNMKGQDATGWSLSES